MSQFLIHNGIWKHYTLSWKQMSSSGSPPKKESIEWIRENTEQKNTFFTEPVFFVFRTFTFVGFDTLVFARFQQHSV